jgi:hypothetical protein
MAVLCAQGMIYQKNTLESIGLKVELPMILEMEREHLILFLPECRRIGDRRCLQGLSIILS